MNDLLHKKIFNENSYIGRFGGDEFVVLLKNPADENFISEKAQKFLNAAKNILFQISLVTKMLLNLQTARYIS